MSGHPIKQSTVSCSIILNLEPIFALLHFTWRRHMVMSHSTLNSERVPVLLQIDDKWHIQNKSVDCVCIFYCHMKGYGSISTGGKNTYNQTHETSLSTVYQPNPLRDREGGALQMRKCICELKSSFRRFHTNVHRQLTLIKQQLSA